MLYFSAHRSFKDFIDKKLNEICINNDNQENNNNTMILFRAIGNAGLSDIKSLQLCYQVILLYTSFVFCVKIKVFSYYYVTLTLLFHKCYEVDRIGTIFAKEVFIN